MCEDGDVMVVVDKGFFGVVALHRQWYEKQKEAPVTPLLKKTKRMKYDTRTII
jgi:hypothetical protein